MKRAVVIASPIIFILCLPPLVYTLAKGVENILVYILYGVSAVSLGGTVWALVCLVKSVRGKHPLERLGTKDERRILFFRISLVAGFAYGIFKLALGIYLSSLWLGITCFYYFALSYARFSIVRHLDWGWKLCRRIGILLLLMNLFASGIISYVVIQFHSILYPGFAIYAIAAWTFYSLISAIVGLVRLKRSQSPVNWCIASVRMSGSLVSLFILQTALISTFGDDPGFKHTMGALTGFSVVVIILVLAIMLIVKGMKRGEDIGKGVEA